MIISVEKFREFAPDVTDPDAVILAKLQALETAVRKHTNNNFQNRNIRFLCPAMATKLYLKTDMLKAGDTVQISQSMYCDGVYAVQEIEQEFIVLDRTLFDETEVLVTKVEYPSDVVMGAVNIVKWQLKNEAANSGDTSKKNVQSETISRHSVTYATDKTEEDISEAFGVPKKHTAFLKGYMKARF